MSIAMAAMMIFSFGSVFAQENYDVPVSSGGSIESDIVTTDFGPSTSLGGIVSSIQSVFERYVTYGGVNVWSTSSNDKIQDFDLLLFPAGSVVDFNSLTACDTVFEVSEADINIRNVTGTWTTYNCAYDASNSDIPIGHVLSEIGVDWETYENGDRFYIYPFSTNDFNYEIVIANVTTSSSATWETCNGICPLEVDLRNAFSLVGPITSYVMATITENSALVISWIDVNTGIKYYLVDYNNDGTFDLSESFSVNGFKTSAQSGEVLSIVPSEQSYDIYGIIA